MKTIMYSPRNSGFIFNRFQSLTRHFIHHFNFVTNIDSRHFSCKKNICFYKQKPYSKHDLFSIYNSERDDYFTYVESYLKHFVDREIDDTMHDFLNDCFLEMIARYHLVKEMLVNHDVDYLFICTSEMYLIDLAREMNVKSIFLEHAPNFFPVNILGTNTMIPSSELKFPDYIISENQLTSRHWRYQCNQLNQSQTQIIETGLPLDNMIVPNDCVKRDNNMFTIAIFNTWLGMGRFENIFQNEFKLMTFFDQLFLLLSDLSKIKPLRIILKNHPKLEQNAYQTRGFYYGLAKTYSIDEFIISEDLESTIQQADLAITLCKSSLLTDLLYARVPSIIFELYDDGIYSNFDDFNDIFPIVSSSEDLYLTLKRHMCLQAHGNYRKKLANIHQKFDLRLRSVDEKCHKLIDFLA